MSNLNNSKSFKFANDGRGFPMAPTKNGGHNKCDNENKGTRRQGYTTTMVRAREGEQ